MLNSKISWDTQNVMDYKMLKKQNNSCYNGFKGCITLFSFTSSTFITGKYLAQKYKDLTVTPAD